MKLNRKYKNVTEKHQNIRTLNNIPLNKIWVPEINSREILNYFEPMANSLTFYKIFENLHSAAMSEC